jgi:glutamate-1-semialdehyde 2,1-aminomutase
MTQSEKLFEKAKNMIPGGVNSPVRAFKSVNGNPIYISKGQGTNIYDVDGNCYVDFCASWGPLVLGHAHPAVTEAVQKTVVDGLSFGTCNPKEIEMAELLLDTIHSMESVRLMNSGTEATMTALRLARGYTGRQKIVKFDGCYHGHTDYLLVSAGSGLLTNGVSSSAGVADSTIADVLIAPYNNLDAVKNIFEIYGNEIAAIIIEPIAGNMGLVKPECGFLQALREITEANGTLLIFDEVISGFRLAATTYGEIAGITPDLTCLGKIIGGGMPIGAVGGRKEIMNKLAPLGDVYQAGTLSGNPVALAAGIATIQTLINENPYSKMEKITARLADAINVIVEQANFNIHCSTLGSMFTIFFSDITEMKKSCRCQNM